MRKVRTNCVHMICVHMYADSICESECVCMCMCVCCAFAFHTKQEYTSSHGHKSRHVDRVGSFRRCSIVIICRAGHGRGDSGVDTVTVVRCDAGGRVRDKSESSKKREKNQNIRSNCWSLSQTQKRRAFQSVVYVYFCKLSVLDERGDRHKSEMRDRGSDGSGQGCVRK